MSHSWIIISSIGLFALGTIFGSFGGVLIERLADDRSWQNIRNILAGRSHCPSCPDQRHLARYELIPLGSWIRQRGRCTQCHQPIPTRYLRLELVSGLVFVMTYLRGVHFHIPMVETIWRYAINRLLLLILIYDLQTQYLHTAIRYLLIAVVVSFLATHIDSAYSVQLVAYSLFIWGGLMWVIWRGASIYARRRYGQTEGMGSGDVMIIATLAPLLPWILHHTSHHQSLFQVVQLFFRELMIAASISLIIAAMLHKKKAGQTLAFLPGLIIARWTITWIAPLLIT